MVMERQRYGAKNVGSTVLFQVFRSLNSSLHKKSVKNYSVSESEST